MILSFIKSCVYLVCILIGVAYFTLAERKVMGSIQRREGPSMVGIGGLLQPFGDALKLAIKEPVVPGLAKRELFIGASIWSFFLSMLGWGVMPLGKGLVVADLELGVLVMLGISGLAVYGVIFSGWSSGSRYSQLGSLRSTAQLISYEVSLTLLIINCLMAQNTGEKSLSFTSLAEGQDIWMVIPALPVAGMFYVSMLAETNRLPFDLPEAESELVSGFMTEYSSMSFAYFFLGEYGSILVISFLFAYLFLGGYKELFSIKVLPEEFWKPFNTTFGALTSKLSGFSLGLKIAFLVFTFIWIRGTFPRLRYDQLMELMWKGFLPLALANLLFSPAYLGLLV